MFCFLLSTLTTASVKSSQLCNKKEEEGSQSSYQTHTFSEKQFVNRKKRKTSYPFFWWELASPFRTVSTVLSINTPCLLQHSKFPCVGVGILTSGSFCNRIQETTMKIPHTTLKSEHSYFFLCGVCVHWWILWMHCFLPLLQRSCSWEKEESPHPSPPRMQVHVLVLDRGRDLDLSPPPAQGGLLLTIVIHLSNRNKKNYI